MKKAPIRPGDAFVHTSFGVLWIIVSVEVDTTVKSGPTSYTVRYVTPKVASSLWGAVMTMTLPTNEDGSLVEATGWSLLRPE